jgi:prepilin-type N-terminal cleavage/methylation domain-containing protein
MRRLLRRNDGFGMIELLVAMMILSIALLAMLAAFTAGTTTVRRAARASTAASIASRQLELYHAIPYNSILLDGTAAAGADPTYKADPSWNATMVTAACPTLPPECTPSRVVTGPDGLSYRLDTYIVPETPTGGRQIKRVAVVVRDPNNLAGRPFTRESTTFDQSTG